MISKPSTNCLVSPTGFTLLELVLVLGLIGLITTMGASGLISWRNGYQLSRAAADVQSLLMKARSLAVKEGMEVQARILRSGDCTIEHMDGSFISSKKIHGSVMVKGDIVFSFNNRGILSSRVGEVELMAVSGKVRRVVVNMIGRTRVE